MRTAWIGSTGRWGISIHLAPKLWVWGRWSTGATWGFMVGPVQFIWFRRVPKSMATGLPINQPGRIVQLKPNERIVYRENGSFIIVTDVVDRGVT